MEGYQGLREILEECLEGKDVGRDLEGKVEIYLDQEFK